MPNGYLLLVLHAHLPFVRHPEYDSFLEENWLFEAISETYLPLLRVMDRLEADDVPFKLSFSISPTLSAMLRDDLLQQRYVRHLDSMLELADRELERTRKDERFAAVARMYKRLFYENRRDFVDKYECDVLKGLDFHSKRGSVELITTAATHAYLPLYQNYPEAIRAQTQVAVDQHLRVFAKPPKGFWLPECGYFPGLEDYLHEQGIRYFFAASHGLVFGYTKPENGVYKPIRCPNGVAVFGRDVDSANAVWSSEEGYPGDPSYRDFYRDIGFDLPLEYIGDFIHEDGIRVHTGFKYHAITDKSDQNKRPYDPVEAERTVAAHAENFIYNQKKQFKKLGKFMTEPPVITSPFDAELFGHWWFEGPQWIESVIRKLHETDTGIEMITASEYLKQQSDLQVAQPAFSSWGNKGYSEVWLDSSNDWIYRHLHKLVERMIDLVDRFPREAGLKKRFLDQAAREVLLSQASDWPFIMRAGTNVEYAVRRIKQHVKNFTTVYDSLSRGEVSTEWLTSVERRHNVFPDLDYRIFARRSASNCESGQLKAGRSL